ncbi:multidrug ABC transporter, partial [Candidatus Uhrbacteria bacterium CG_4_10_14_0_2_um_filter_41_7]
RRRFSEVNAHNYKSAVGAGIANISLTPVYGLASNFGQLIVLAYGISLISSQNFTIGLLISFLAYSNSFYNPLRQIAALWTSLQTALASWDRVSEILLLENDLPIIKDVAKRITDTVLEFKGVNFRYPDGKEVLHNVNLNLEKGKTYALVGPTGGGKTTTASLMSRLYDPTNGEVVLCGKDIKTYSAKERAEKIGFILQEPILFSGTVFDNILYANEEYKKFTVAELEEVIKQSGLQELINRFDKGLLTEISVGGEDISLGQKQLIAFIRAVLRKPEVLILDEATANIDTVTEQLLENILAKLPDQTTKIIIAHRLNTIENADEIFFVNSGNVIKAGSMKRAVEMLLHGNMKS